MKVHLTLEDRGAKTVLFDMEASSPNEELENNIPTPSAIMAIAVKALFENGMLARMGQLALEGISKGRAPSEYLTEKYKENT